MYNISNIAFYTLFACHKILFLRKIISRKIFIAWHSNRSKSKITFNHSLKKNIKYNFKLIVFQYSRTI